MDTIYRGELHSRRGRAIAWIDALLVDHGLFRMVWRNWAAVVPGRLYRSSHPMPGQLASAARRFRLKTVINLRGLARNGADALTREMAARLGLDFIDMAVESRGAPHRDRVLRLAQIYQTMREPALIHCKSGADRAGLAAALFLMLEGAGTKAALDQLSWRFGHFNHAKTGILDAFFLRYAREAEGRKPFLEWVREDYDEAALRRDYVPSGLASFLVDRLLQRE